MVTLERVEPDRKNWAGAILFALGRRYASGKTGASQTKERKDEHLSSQARTLKRTFSMYMIILYVFCNLFDSRWR